MSCSLSLPPLQLPHHTRPLIRVSAHSSMYPRIRPGDVSAEELQRLLSESYAQGVPLDHKRAKRILVRDTTNHSDSIIQSNDNGKSS